jgi:uncharacterized protein (TIGR00251 family)
VGQQHTAPRHHRLGVLIPRPARDPLHELVEAAEGGVVVNVHVLPRAGATKVAGRHGNALKVRVAAPPVDGRATDTARRAIAAALDVPPSAVSLVSGERSRAKRFLVEGMSADVAIARIGALLAVSEG